MPTHDPTGLRNTISQKISPVFDLQIIITLKPLSIKKIDDSDTIFEVVTNSAFLRTGSATEQLVRNESINKNQEHADTKPDGGKIDRSE